jgi:hypothetical protein
MSVKKYLRFPALCMALFPLTLSAQVPAVAPKDSIRTDPFLENLLGQNPQYFDSVLKKKKIHQVQVIYTSIDRGANGIAGLKHYYFNVNPSGYFYPASTVKLPVAMLALQGLNELKAYGIDKNTTMLTGKDHRSQTAVYNDPTSPDGRPTIAHYLKRLLQVSDHDAYNRLYEFLGQQYANYLLHAKGYPDAVLNQRLGLSMTDEENRHTNPVSFAGRGNKALYHQAGQYNKANLPGRSSKTERAGNRISLEDLHNMLISLVFPNKVTASQRFDITDEDRIFLLKYMSQLPTESFSPPYGDDTATYYPAYTKYLLYGKSRDTVQKNIRIFNASGEGYGQITDVAYIVDFDKKIEFFLSATIYCNSNSTNGKTYDYENAGFPFMKYLGQVIYEYETKREKKNLHNLTDLMFEYDGR